MLPEIHGCVARNSWSCRPKFMVMSPEILLNVKVLPLCDNPPHYELTVDPIRPPLEVVQCMRLLGLTIDSSISFKVHVNSICNKVNVKVASLRRVR